MMTIQQVIAAVVAFAVVMAGSILFRKNEPRPSEEPSDEAMFDIAQRTWLERMALRYLDSKAKSKMMHAGFRAPFDIVVFWLFRPALAIVFGVIGLVIASDGGDTMFLSIIVASGLLLGWWIPGAWLDFKVQSRVAEIAVNLPMMFDLIEVCIRGGMSLDSAWTVVQKQMQLISEPLAEEIQSMEFEVRLGMDRYTALRRMGDRTGISGFSSLASLLSQSERFGTGVAETFMIHADALRYEELQSMEERAHVASIKVLIPIGLFLVPAVLIILGGPMLILVIRGLQDIS